MGDDLVERLKPCPFCGSALFMRGSVNDYGRCETLGCWMNERKMTVQLDDPRQVSGWNTRAESTTLQQQRREIEELREAVRVFIAKLDLCEPHVVNAFFMAHTVRGGQYDGPNWRDELTALRLLSAPDNPKGGG